MLDNIAVEVFFYSTKLLNLIFWGFQIYRYAREERFSICRTKLLNLFYCINVEYWLYHYVLEWSSLNKKRTERIVC
jgi:hypothetical protein